MRTIVKLFSRSPFLPLQTHMEKVGGCVQKVAALFYALGQGDYETIEKLSKVISQLEHEADLAKYDIQSHLPRSMFLPVDRGRLLEILSIQDSIADKCENIAVMLTFKRLTILEPLQEPFQAFLKKNVEAFGVVQNVIEHLDELVATGFGGAAAERVQQMVVDVALKEHEVDILQRELLKILFAHDEQIGMGTFYLWCQVIRQVSELSNLSERLANRVRTTLELK